MNPVASEKENFFDFNPDAEDNSRFTVPDGTYGVTITDVFPKKSSTGRPMFVFVFTGLEGVARGKQFRQYNLNEEGFKWKIANILKAAGLPVGSFNKADIVGKNVNVTLEQRPFGDGKVSMDVVGVEPFSGPAPSGTPY